MSEVHPRPISTKISQLDRQIGERRGKESFANVLALSFALPTVGLGVYSLANTLAYNNYDHIIGAAGSFSLTLMCSFLFYSMHQSAAATRLESERKLLQSRDDMTN